MTASDFAFKTQHSATSLAWNNIGKFSLCLLLKQLESLHVCCTSWLHLTQAFPEGLWEQQWNKHEPRRRSWQHLVERASTPHPCDQTSAMLDGHGTHGIWYSGIGRRGCNTLSCNDTGIDQKIGLPPKEQQKLNMMCFDVLWAAFALFKKVRWKNSQKIWMRRF